MSIQILFSRLRLVTEDYAQQARLCQDRLDIYKSKPKQLAALFEVLRTMLPDLERALRDYLEELSSMPGTKPTTGTPSAPPMPSIGDRGRQQSED